MTANPALRGLSRRELLAAATMAGTAFAIGAGFLAAPDAAWAYETTAIKPATMATLVQMARDIYPHDRVADNFYLVAVKGYDTPEAAPMIEEGIAALDAAARGAGYKDYLSVGWEADRVALLRGMEQSPFFQKIRGGLVVGLYNQHEVWPIFGYEGESFSKGGYINRGFNDISWL